MVPVDPAGGLLHHCGWPVQVVGPPSSIASVLNSPMVDSHRALSRASPTVTIDPAMPASSSSAVNATDVNRAGVGVVDHLTACAGAGPLCVAAVSGMEGLTEGVEDQLGPHRGADPPAQDPT